MELIIVTMCDQKTGNFFDVEVPVKLEISKLAIDIAQTIMGHAPELSWDLSKIALFSPRLQKMLNHKNSLYDEGIWNGDYLFITTNYEV